MEMLRDRHIDQLMMCAVYVMAKVTKEDKSFHDIMKWYRTQPQATSDVSHKPLFSFCRPFSKVENLLVCLYPNQSTNQSINQSINQSVNPIQYLLSLLRYFIFVYDLNKSLEDFFVKDKNTNLPG